MSSSAFTPTQIEVTNEVPVNVPVVTAWEDVSSPSIPTGLGSGSGTWAYYKTRRVGGNLEILARFNKDATAGTGSTNVSFSLPYSNITIDSSVNTIGYATSFFVGGVAGFRTLTAARGTSTTFVFDKDLGADAVKGSDIVGGAQLRFFVSLPIAEWAGSGTTTLATRAVEEYAWNSSTTTTDDLTSFGNGPEGVNIRSFAPTGNNAIEKRVRFQSPILPTDTLVLEFNNGSGWANAADVGGAYYSNDAGTALFGQVVRHVSGSTTDVSVFFLSKSAGLSSWSALATWKWRVRKVSAGAQVGYPISTKNIVGATDGVAPVTGMLGERITWVTPPATQTMTSTEADWTNANITLTPGVWLVKANISARASSAAVAGSAGACYIKITDSSNNLIQNSEKHLATFTETNTISRVIGMVSFDFVANISSNTTYKIRAYSNGATAEAIVINASTAWSDFFAIRIA